MSKPARRLAAVETTEDGDLEVVIDRTLHDMEGRHVEGAALRIKGTGADLGSLNNPLAAGGRAYFSGERAILVMEVEFGDVTAKIVDKDNRASSNVIRLHDCHALAVAIIDPSETESAIDVLRAHKQAVARQKEAVGQASIDDALASLEAEDEPEEL